MDLKVPPKVSSAAVSEVQPSPVNIHWDDDGDDGDEYSNADGVG